MTDVPSNYRATESLPSFLTRHGVPAITGVDTRRLTRHLRDAGAMNAAFGALDEPGLACSCSQSSEAPPVSISSRRSPQVSLTIVGNGPHRVVAYDFGIKETILQELGHLATIEVVPARTPAADILARNPRRCIPLQRSGQPRDASVGRAEREGSD